MILHDLEQHQIANKTCPKPRGHRREGRAFSLGTSHALSLCLCVLDPVLHFQSCPVGFVAGAAHPPPSDRPVAPSPQPWMKFASGVGYSRGSLTLCHGPLQAFHLQTCLPAAAFTLAPYLRPLHSLINSSAPPAMTFR